MAEAAEGQLADLHSRLDSLIAGVDYNYGGAIEVDGAAAGTRVRSLGAVVAARAQGGAHR